MIAAMNRATPPPRTEVKEFCVELESAGVSVPSTVTRALSLADRVERLAQPPDIAAYVASVDLSNTGEQALMNAWRRSVVQLQLSTPAGRALLRDLLEALTARAVAALADDRQRMLDELAAKWDAHGLVDIVQAAKEAGLTSSSGSSDAIRLGARAIAVWSDLDHTLRVMDALHDLRNRLILITGGTLADEDAGPQRWLDRIPVEGVPA